MWSHSQMVKTLSLHGKGRSSILLETIDGCTANSRLSYKGLLDVIGKVIK